jgi:hypothetical protein
MGIARSRSFLVMADEACASTASLLHSREAPPTTSTMVDWTVALSTPADWSSPALKISHAGAAAAVADWRGCAGRAEEYVQQVTGPTAPRGLAPVLVVDRLRWIEANIDGFGRSSPPQRENRRTGSRTPTRRWSASAPGSPASRSELCSTILAQKVLAQFDPFYPGVQGCAAFERRRDRHGHRAAPGDGCCWSLPRCRR